MATYENLKTSIEQYIKTNYNQEITGDTLKMVLLNIVSILGENASYAGVALPTTSPGTPEGPVFYIASTPGDYVNFGNLTIDQGENALLSWDGNSWSKSLFSTNENINLQVQSYPTSILLSPNGLIENKDIDSDTGAIVDSTIYCVTKDYMPIFAGVNIYVTGGLDSGRLWIYFYDENLNFISRGTVDANKIIINIPINAKYFRTICTTAQKNNLKVYAAKKTQNDNYNPIEGYTNNLEYKINSCITDKNDGSLLSEDNILYNTSLTFLGFQQQDNRYNASEYIAVNATKKLYVKSSNNYLYCYDENYFYLGRFSVNSSVILAERNDEYKNAKYVRIEWLINSTPQLSYSPDISKKYNPISCYLNGLLKKQSNQNLIDVNELILNRSPSSVNGIIRDDNGFFTTQMVKIDPNLPYSVVDAYNDYFYCYDENLSWIGRHSSKTALFSKVNGFEKTRFICIIGKMGINKNPSIFIGTNNVGLSKNTKYAPISAANENVDLTIVQRNQDAMPILSAVAYKNRSNSFKRQKNFTVCHFSDVHGDFKRAKNAIDFLNEFDEIDCGIFSGDSEYGFWGDGKYGFETSILPNALNSNKLILQTIGNHDSGLNDAVKCSQADMFNRFFKPLLSKMGLPDSYNKLYYLKDFDDYKIRVIVLNEYDTPRTINTADTSKYLAGYDMWRRFINQEQATWFSKALLSTAKNTSFGLPDDYSVIVCLHQIPAQPDFSDFKDNQFLDLNHVNVGTSDYKTNQEVSLLYEIIDAFKLKTSLNKTYQPTSNITGQTVTSMGTVTIGVDYSDRNSSNFICWLNGHTHIDLVGKIKNAQTNQIFISVTNQSFDIGSQYDSLARIEDTKAEDAFNIIGFDTDNKIIKVCRIGNNMPSDLRPRSYTSISYK